MEEIIVKKPPNGGFLVIPLDIKFVSATMKYERS